MFKKGGSFNTVRYFDFHMYKTEDSLIKLTFHSTKFFFQPVKLRQCLRLWDTQVQETNQGFPELWPREIPQNEEAPKNSFASRYWGTLVNTIQPLGRKGTPRPVNLGATIKWTEGALPRSNSKDMDTFLEELTPGVTYWSEKSWGFACLNRPHNKSERR